MKDKELLTPSETGVIASALRMISGILLNELATGDPCAEGMGIEHVLGLAALAARVDGRTFEVVA